MPPRGVVWPGAGAGAGATLVMDVDSVDRWSRAQELPRSHEGSRLVTRTNYHLQC